MPALLAGGGARTAKARLLAAAVRDDGDSDGGDDEDLSDVDDEAALERAALLRKKGEGDRRCPHCGSRARPTMSGRCASCFSDVNGDRTGSGDASTGVKPISEGDRFEQELAAHNRGEKVTSLLGEKLDYDEFARDPKKAEALGKEVAALVAEAKRKEDAHLTLKHASSRRGGKKR